MRFDEALLDELARVYAEAAVRAALSDCDSQKAQRPVVSSDEALFVHELALTVVSIPNHEEIHERANDTPPACAAEAAV
jgi:hypothetical protein